MAIKFYGGTPGAGKSHEVVENVILPAIRQGRRVVTNVAGLQYDEICDYLVSAGADESKLGTIYNIQLTDDIAGKLAIVEGEGDTATLNESSIVKGGDVVVLDEVWRIWEAGCKLHADDRKFLRMHRHLLHPETLVSCDIVLIAQSFADLHRVVARLVEERFEMTKHISLGMAKRYAVNVYAKGSRKAHVTYQRKYKPEIFAFYKSHSLGKGDGKELSVDKRGNIFRGSLFQLVIPVGILLAIAATFFVWRFFNPPVKKVDDLTAVKTAPASGSLEGRALANEEASDTVSSSYRVVGYAAAGGQAVVFLDLGARGLRQIVLPDENKVFGQYIEFEFEGKTVGVFSGGNRKSPEKSDSQVSSLPAAR